MKTWSKEEVTAVGEAIIRAEAGDVEAGRAVRKLMSLLRQDGAARRREMEQKETLEKLNRMRVARGLPPLTELK